MHAAAKKLLLVTPILEKAVQITQDVPRKANDAMTLSMIYGYEGNIQAYGQIILQVGMALCVCVCDVRSMKFCNALDYGRCGMCIEKMWVWLMCGVVGVLVYLERCGCVCVGA